MLTKEDIKKDLSDHFRGKEIAVSQGEQPWLFTAAVADMIYCEHEYFSGWAQIMAKVDIDTSESNRLSRHKQQLEVDLRENMDKQLGLSEVQSD